MITNSHMKAFHLVFISKDRKLTPPEQSFLEGHFSTCDSCRAQAEIHQLLQKSHRSHIQSSALPKKRFQMKLPQILKVIEKKRMVQKTTNIILTTTKLGVAFVMIGFLLWVLYQNSPKPTPAISTVEPSTTPRFEVVPTDKVSEQRTEIIIYTVKQSDTIFGIANNFQLKPETILWGNLLIFSDDGNILRPGMELNILPVDGVYYEWQEGDDLNAVALKFGVMPEDIIDWPGNHLNSETLGNLSRPNIDPGTMLVIPGGQFESLPWTSPRYP